MSLPKQSMPHSSDEQSSIKKDIPTTKLELQPCCFLQNIEQSITLEILSTSEVETTAFTSGEKLTESLKEMDSEKNLSIPTEEVQVSDTTSVTLQPISFETSLTSQSETIEILPDCPKDNSFRNNFSSATEEEEEMLAKATLPPTLMLSTAENKTKNTKIEILTESLKENVCKNNFSSTSEEVEDSESASVTLQQTNLPSAETTVESEDITYAKMEILSKSLKEIDINVSSEEQESESAPITLQPISIAASSSSQSDKASSSVETLGEKLKRIDLKKKLGIPSEGEDGESAAMTLGVYLDSIKISALISTSFFLEKRGPYLRKLADEAVKFHAFMESVNNLRHEFQPCLHTSLSCLTLIPEGWRRLTRNWEIFQRQIGGLIDTTVLIMQQCEDNSLLLREEFVTYLDNLMVTSEDLGELEDMCNTALDKYRSVCFNYDNYYFLLHLATTSAHLKPLQDRLTQECGKCSSFEAEINEQIKQAEGKIDDLF